MARGGHGDSLKFRPGSSCPTFLCPAGGPPLKQPYGRFRDGPPARQAVCSHLLPHWTPHAVRVWYKVSFGFPRQDAGAKLAFFAVSYCYSQPPRDGALGLGLGFDTASFACHMTLKTQHKQSDRHCSYSCSLSPVVMFLLTSLGAIHGRTAWGVQRGRGRP
jgi:hypothetical protein